MMATTEMRIPWPVLLVAVCGCLLIGCQLDQKNITSPPPSAGADPKATLAIKPSEASAGDAFTFALSGARPGETVLFEVLHPDGTKFIGPPHTVGADGSVTATYSTAYRDQAGPYKVLAAGNRGTVVHTSFTVDVPPPITPTT
jgi:hypothetical protein